MRVSPAATINPPGHGSVFLADGLLIQLNTVLGPFTIRVLVENPSPRIPCWFVSAWTTVLPSSNSSTWSFCCMLNPNVPRFISSIITATTFSRCSPQLGFMDFSYLFLNLHRQILTSTCLSFFWRVRSAVVRSAPPREPPLGLSGHAQPLPHTSLCVLLNQERTKTRVLRVSLGLRVEQLGFWVIFFFTNGSHECLLIFASQTNQSVCKQRLSISSRHFVFGHIWFSPAILELLRELIQSIN